MSNIDEPEAFAGVVRVDSAGVVSEREQMRLLHGMLANQRIARAREGWHQEYLDAERKVGGNIREHRLLAEMSQEQLARSMSRYGFDLHQSTIAKIESGTRPIRIAELYAFADALGVPWMSLIEGSRWIDILPNKGMVPIDIWEANIEEFALEREAKMDELVAVVEEKAREYAMKDRDILIQVAALANAAARARKVGEEFDSERVDSLVTKWLSDADTNARRRDEYDLPERQKERERLIAENPAANQMRSLVAEFVEWRARRGNEDGQAADTAE